jgi:metal-responsive CopG/Arc/MetJ family transcriptional regulator
MKKSEKIAISLPSDVLKAVNAQCKGTGESRSAFFRRAAGDLLRRQKEQEAIKRYVEGYLRMPETEAEVAEMDAIAVETMKMEPWDDQR